jgi:hypothetical protein
MTAPTALPKPPVRSSAQPAQSFDDGPAGGAVQDTHLIIHGRQMMMTFHSNSGKTILFWNLTILFLLSTYFRGVGHPARPEYRNWPGLYSFPSCSFCTGQRFGGCILLSYSGRYRQTEIIQIKTGSHASLSSIRFPKNLLSTILVANNFINVSIIVLAALFSGNIFDFGVNPVTGFILEVVLHCTLAPLFGEILPKVYATRNHLRFRNLNMALF